MFGHLWGVLEHLHRPPLVYVLSHSQLSQPLVLASWFIMSRTSLSLNVAVATLLLLVVAVTAAAIVVEIPPTDGVALAAPSTKQLGSASMPRINERHLLVALEQGMQQELEQNTQGVLLGSAQPVAEKLLDLISSFAVDGGTIGDFYNSKCHRSVKITFAVSGAAAASPGKIRGS